MKIAMFKLQFHHHIFLEIFAKNNFWNQYLIAGQETDAKIKPKRCKVGLFNNNRNRSWSFSLVWFGRNLLVFFFSSCPSTLSSSLTYKWQPVTSLVEGPDELNDKKWQQWWLIFCKIGNFIGIMIIIIPDTRQKWLSGMYCWLRLNYIVWGPVCAWSSIACWIVLYFIVEGLFVEFNCLLDWYTAERRDV